MAKPGASPKVRPPKSALTTRRALVTPEGVDLGVDIATGGERLGAFLLDLLMIVGCLLALTLVVLFAAWASGAEEKEIYAVIWLLGFFCLRNLWFIGFEMREGAATPGKRIMKIRVAARDGGRLTADAVFARNLMRELEVMAPLTLMGMSGGNGWFVLAAIVWSLLFLLFPLFNRDRLRVGDFIAGTWVLKAPRVKLLPDLAETGNVLASEFAFSPRQVDAYGVMELQVLEDVLRKAEAKTIRAVAERIRAKIEWTQGGAESDTAFLRAYYAALRRRLEQRLLFGKRRADKHDNG